MIAAALVTASLITAGGTLEQSNGALRSTIDVNTVVLRASQVGPGYRSAVIPGGRKVRGQATLDLCGYHYRSEALRVQRIQRAYTRPASPPQVSNEVVRYRHGGTAVALRELERAVAHCPHGPVAGVTYRVKHLAFHGLLPHSIALQVHISGISQGRRFGLTGMAVYQVRGALLSGVYTYSGSIAVQKRFALHAAHESAMNLHHA